MKLTYIYNHLNKYINTMKNRCINIDNQALQIVIFKYLNYASNQYIKNKKYHIISIDLLSYIDVFYNMIKANIMLLLKCTKDTFYRHVLCYLNKILVRLNLYDEQKTSTLINVKIFIKWFDIYVKKILYTFPNILDESVTCSNELIHTYGVKKKSCYDDNILKLLDHKLIAERLQLFDFIKSTKMSGRGYVVYLKDGLLLKHELLHLFRKMSHVYDELLAPLIVWENAAICSGHLPKFKKELFCIDETSYLVPTAEMNLVNLFLNCNISYRWLPYRIASFTPCFRGEIGHHGQLKKGLFWLHQFYKYELFTACTPLQSNDEFNLMKETIVKTLNALKLTFWCIWNSAKDTAFQSAITYDYEVWLPLSQIWLEVSSCSLTTDFQSIWTKARYQKKDHTSDYLYFLNGSCLPIERIILCLIENYFYIQNKHISLNLDQLPLNKVQFKQACIKDILN